MIAHRLAAAVVVLTAAGVLPGGAAAQSLDLSGYALGVAAHARPGDLGPGGTSWLGRARLMATWTQGPVSVEAAYEHLLQRNPPGGGFSITTPGGTGTAGTGDWLGVDWTLRETSRDSWRHRFDRLAVSFDAGDLEVTAGRQAISWATTLYLTPADPFSPFDPSDPFREYRGGVDALRVRFSPDPFSELEAVVRPAKTPFGTTLTALARGQTSVGSWALGAWGGLLHDEAAGAVFATGAVGATAVRGEAEIGRDPGGGVVARGAMGVDRRFSVVDRDLYVVAELQVDGFGASSASQLAEVLASEPYGRGEMQVLGRTEAALQASYQIHPLVSLDLMGLADLSDGSVLLAPGASWLATGAATVRAGLFAGLGKGATNPLRLGSEYGSVPGIGYLSLSWFF